MPLQVIGAGLGRTGTLSLKVALEQLGFDRCYHMTEVLINPAHAPLWIEAAEGRPDWQRLFDGYRATVDYPGCRHWRELADAYPEAKVILSLRDPDKWFESTQATIFAESARHRFMFPELTEFFDRLVYAQFGDRLHDRDFMIAEFRRHNDEVRNSIAPERLLVFEARQGWEPLCEFLDVPVPAAPFPRTNSREEMAAMREAAARTVGGPTPFTLEQMSEMVRRRLASLRDPE
jgi:Sulfotransferase domain